MSNQQALKLSSFKRLVLAAMAASGVMASSAVQAERANESLYLAASYGLHFHSRCDGAQSCNRGTDAMKFSAGYRVTPGWAYEINYFRLGEQERSWETGPKSFETLKTHALGLGFSLDTELFSFMTQHIRGGLAYVENENKREWRNGTLAKTTKDAVIPYVGVGMSMPVNPNFRIQTGVDVLINRDRTNYLLTVGGTADF